MLHPHSLLWHYLWVGPDLLLLCLAFMSWHRGLHRLFPAFFFYLVFEAIYGLALWTLDVTPAVSNDVYWRSDIVGLAIESLVKIAVFRELFSELARQRPDANRIGRFVAVCALLILATLAVMSANHAPILHYRLVSYADILEQTIYLLEAGFLLFMFLFAASLRLTWERRNFGIALGLSVSSCVGLGAFAIFSNISFFKQGNLLNFVIMGSYHACVLIWTYYLLSTKSGKRNCAATSRSSHSEVEEQVVIGQALRNF
jgi:hypothetical protein